MKKITLILSTVMFFSMVSFSQVQEGDIKLFQEMFGADKVAMVKQYLELTPQQDSVFWKDYEPYEAARKELGKRKVLALDDYGKNYMSLTDDKATELVNEVIAIDLEFKQLQKTYFKKMSKSVGALKAAQFFQFESYLNNAINIMIQENIPFVGDMEKMRK